MGTINTKFFKDLSEKATWSAGVAFKRSNPLPIDKYSVFETIALAEEYASTSAVAYPGQVIAAYDSDNDAMQVYVLSEVANEVAEGEEQTYSLALQEIGGKVSADNLSIEYNEDGLLELSGFTAADGLSLPQKQADGTLKWVGIDAIVEGDGNTTYKFTLNTNSTGFTVTPVDAGVDGTPVEITLDVYTKSEVDAAIKAERERAIAAEDNISKLIGTASINDPDGKGEYIPATGLFADIEALDMLKADITYVDDEIAALEDAVSKLNHFTTKIVTSTDDVTETGILYLIKDDSVSGVDKYNEYLYVNNEAVLIGDTTTDLSDYFTKNEVNAAISQETVAREALAGRVAILEETDNATQAELNAYKEEVIEALNGKADIATTLAGYGITDAYTKTETLDKIAEKITEINGGESAGEVLSQLNSYKETNDIRVDAIESKLSTVEDNSEKNIIEIIKANGTALTVDQTDRSVDITAAGLGVYTTSEVDGKILAVSDIVNAAKTATETNALNIKTIQETTIPGVKAIADKNAEDIAALTAKVAIEEGKVGSLETIVNSKAESSTVTALAEQVGSNEANITSLLTRVSTNESAITTLTSKVSANEGAITGINEALNLKANSADVYSKTEVDAITGTPTEGKTLVQMILDAQTSATYDDTQIKADIKANTEAIAILNSDDKTEGSVDYKVALEVAKILNDNDDSDIDTLNEIAAWIVNDTTGAAKMNADISANTAAITKLNGDVNTPGSVLSMIASNAPAIATSEIAGIVKSTAAENGISVAQDGTMSVNSISVNKLVQSEDDILVLNGGTSI